MVSFPGTFKYRPVDLCLPSEVGEAGGDVP